MNRNFSGYGNLFFNGHITNGIRLVAYYLSRCRMQPEKRDRPLLTFRADYTVPWNEDGLKDQSTKSM
jgi:hypothetical protein